MNLEELLIDVAMRAGQVLRDHAFDFGKIEWKKEDDPVTELDKRIEKEIKANVLNVINANFVGEEYGIEDNGSELTFYIDPIDGTKSFINRDFYSSISVGVSKGNEMIGGVVYDFMRDIMYVGANGTFRVLYSGIDVDLKKCNVTRVLFDEDVIQKFDGLKTVHQNGSIALKMAQTAAKQYDAMVIFENEKGGEWDVAAGCYLLSAAEYELEDTLGNPYNYHTQENGIVAYKKEVKPIVERIIEEVSAAG